MRSSSEIVNDVVVGGVIVLRRGSLATGVVTPRPEPAQAMGRAGRLSFMINDIKLVNRPEVPVRAFNRTSGENRTGEMIGMSIKMPIVSAPFFLLMHGTSPLLSRAERESEPLSMETSA